MWRGDGLFSNPLEEGASSIIDFGSSVVVDVDSFGLSELQDNNNEIDAIVAIDNNLKFFI